jgi:membrane protein required for colicin V production
MQVSPLDIVFAVLILASSIYIAVKGFVEEFSSMAAFVLGILAGVLFLKPGAVLVDSWGVHGVFAPILAFLGAFIIVFVVIKLVVGMLGKILESVHLDSLNHALGFFLGLAEGVLWVSVILVILKLQPFFDATKLLNGSFAASVLLPIINVDAIIKLIGAGAKSGNA